MKRYGCLLLALFCLFSFNQSFAGVTGDIDASGETGVGDAITALQISAGLSPEVRANYFDASNVWQDTVIDCFNLIVAMLDIDLRSGQSNNSTASA